MIAEPPPRPTGLLLAEVEAERARMQQVLEDEAARERAEAFLAERLRDRMSGPEI